MPEAPLYLLDTNILLRYVRNDPVAQWIHDNYSFEDPAVRRAISTVSEGELRSLAIQFGWGSARIERMEQLIGRAFVVPIEFQGVVEAYARIDAHCRRVGTPVCGHGLRYGRPPSDYGPRLRPP